MPRRRVRVWAGGVAAALLVSLGASELSGWPFLRAPAERLATRAAAVPVALDGRFRLHLVGRPRLEIDHLRIAPGGGIVVPHLLDAREVELGWRWADLWRWRQGAPLRVDRLHAGMLDANLVRDAAGHASWQIGRPRDSAVPPRFEPLEGLPRFGSLRVGAGRIGLDDAPLETKLAIALRGGEGAGGAAYDAQVEGRWRALPLALTLHTTGTLPLMQDALAEAAATPVPMVVDGRVGAARLHFDGRASALLGERRLQGRLEVRGPSLAQVGAPFGLTLPQTPPFALAGDLAHGDGVWRLHAAQASIGRSRLGGDYDFDTRSTPPRLTGRLTGTRLALADLAPAVGQTAAPARGNAASANRRAPAKVLPQRRFDLPSLAAMNADLQVAIDELDFGSEALAPLRPLRTRLLLQDRVLRLQDLQAATAGGRFSGQTELDARRDPPRWAADLQLAGIDTAGWLRGLRSERGAAEAPRDGDVAALARQRRAARQGGRDEPVRALLTGTLGGHVQVNGRGRSTGEILATLDGEVRLLLRDGTVSHLVTELAGLDVAQALGVWLRRDDPLPLRCARVDLVVQQGIVRPRVAVLDNKDSTVRLDGVVNLRDETLALRATTHPKDFSPLALRAPVTVGGTFAQPALGVEGGRLAARLLGSVALGAAVGPLAALVPLIDPGSRDPGDPCAEAAAPAPAKAPR